MPCTRNSHQQHHWAAQTLGCKPRSVLSQYRVVRFMQSSAFPSRNTIHSFSSPSLLCGIGVLRVCHIKTSIFGKLCCLPEYNNLRITPLLIHNVLTLEISCFQTEVEKSHKMRFCCVSQTHGLKQQII